MNAAWTLVTAATDPAITLANAKLHLRVVDTAEDTLIAARVTAATLKAETYLGRGLLPQTWKYAQDAFSDVMWLPMAAPLSSVSSVKYYDAAGTLQTLSSSVYLVDSVSEPARVVLAPNQSWPVVQSGRPLAVEITYIVGWATAAAIPANILAGVYLCLGSLHEHRESMISGTIVAELPDGVEALWSNRVFWREPSCQESR